MLTHNIPWQAVLADVVSRHVVFGSAMLLSLISGYFNWWVLFTACFLAVGVIIVIRLIPTMLNLSRDYFKTVASDFIIYIVVTIIAFALHHKSAGLVEPSGKVATTFIDALYFSVTTFTTLGYGDLRPVPEMRLATSIEAFLGMISFALAMSMLWLWCQENLVPKEMAFFDGNRRHKKSLSVSRIRIRTLTGKERKLKDWRPTPQSGEVFYYDKERQEWLEAQPDTELPEGTLAFRAISEDDSD